MPFRICVTLALAAAALSGCATDRTYGADPSYEITELETLPAPRGEIFYTIGSQEKLEIGVVGAEELTGVYLTDEDGNLDFPLVGKVAIGGQSPTNASKMIADGLRGRFIVDPQVRVIPEEFTPPSISIGGQVNRPGAYPATGRETLLRVVNMAEGLAEYAKFEDVLIMRTVDGQRYIGLYNIAAIQRGNYPDPALYPDDIVMVGDSPARRRLDNILQFAPLLTSAAIVIDRVGI